MQGAQISDNCSIGFCSSLEAEAEKFYLPRTRLNRYQSSVEQYEPRSEGVVLLVRAHLSRHLMTEVVSDSLEQIGHFQIHAAVSSKIDLAD